MAVSYITLLTAFDVDNGPRLPLWKLLPPITFWFLPAAIGRWLRALSEEMTVQRLGPDGESVAVRLRIDVDAFASARGAAGRPGPK
ncbi:hypothetical protein SAMN04489713_105223 [Actinomadura madurae]|uniref:Uncharacterized protein n=1 Tax=Actinomadura madurae TaxID=1993 RepID=A0A1I5GI98_9ACTN|nr:hypothetical protein [Actinomadura madurae]SFO35748.1 hypothetical protein SAMN04489713_105223 [Actinomadura madurae]